MKKTNLILAFVILTLVLTACGSASSTKAPAHTTSSTASVSMESQLAVGTLKLDATEQAVDATLANELLPLWQLLLQLKTSGSTATEEVDAVTKKIQQTMTVEQIRAIADLQITQEDVTGVIEERSLAGSKSKSTTSNANSGSPGGPGGPPDGGLPMGTGFAPQQSATTQSHTSQSSASSSSTLVIKEVIKVLEAKIQG